MFHVLVFVLDEVTDVSRTLGHERIVNTPARASFIFTSEYMSVYRSESSLLKLAEIMFTFYF